MPKLTPEEAREKHARRLKAATEDIRRGVMRVSEAPGVKAAQKVDKMRARLLEKIDDGTWARRVASVSLEEWRKLMTEKGIGRIAAGIDGAAEKMEDFFSQLFEYQDRLQQKIKDMPDLTFEDNVNRMVTWVRGMKEFSKK